MILEHLKSWTGKIELNGIQYESIQAVQDTPGVDKHIESIKLYRHTENSTRTIQDCPGSVLYKISVRKYMTMPANPGFDFMSHWNNNVPMPMRTMVGYIEKETAGMVFANLWGDISSPTQYCMRCGKQITNPVSQYFGMGPECGQHNYVNPFNSDEELHQAVQSYRKNYLQKIQWKGWILKSAITDKEVLNDAEQI